MLFVIIQFPPFSEMLKLLVFHWAPTRLSPPFCLLLSSSLSSVHFLISLPFQTRAAVSTRITVIMKNQRSSAATDSSSSLQNWPAHPSRHTHSPFWHCPPCSQIPPHPALISLIWAMVSDAWMFSTTETSAHWWMDSSSDNCWVKLRMQWVQVRSLGSLNSLPSKPDEWPHGNHPS